MRVKRPEHPTSNIEHPTSKGGPDGCASAEAAWGEAPDLGLVLALKDFLKYLLHSVLPLLYSPLRLTHLGTDSITCGTDN
jgi:hypothetical protein